MLAVLLAAAGVLPDGAIAGSGVDIGRDFGAIAVDDIGRHVFVSDPTANVVYEFDFAGHLHSTIANVYGAWGMVIRGRELYVVEHAIGAVVAVDLTAPTLAPTTVASGLNGPVWVADTGGLLWVALEHSIASVDPATGTVTNGAGGAYYEPYLATSPGAPHTLFVAELGLSPGAVFRVEVSASPPTVIASNGATEQSNIEGLAVSPDATRVIPAAGYPYHFQELSGSTLAPDGLIYPGDAYPSAVAVSASGMLVTGLDKISGSPDIQVVPLGTPAATFSAVLRSGDGYASILPGGLALSADGSMVFAVTGFHTVDPRFFAISTAPDLDPPTISCDAPPLDWSSVNRTVSCTADDAQSGLVNRADASFTLTTGMGVGFETNAAYTTSRKVCDVAGNCAQAGPIGPIKIDIRGPTIACASPAAGWSATDISVPCTATDGGIGLASAADASFALTTSVGVGTETSAAFTSTRQVCDQLGNCSTASAFGPLRVDRRPPAITCDPPPAGLFHGNVPIACRAADAGSGLASATDSEFLLATEVAAGSHDAAAYTGTRRVCDAAGNCATAGPVGPIQVDVPPAAAVPSTPATTTPASAPTITTPTPTAAPSRPRAPSAQCTSDQARVKALKASVATDTRRIRTGSTASRARARKARAVARRRLVAAQAVLDKACAAG